MTIEIIMTGIMALFVIGIFMFCWHVAAERERQRKEWFDNHHFNHDWSIDDDNAGDSDKKDFDKLDEKAYNSNHTWID